MALQGWCERKKVVILHNNCILGEKKTGRFVVKGFWYAGEDGVRCMQEPAPMTKEALQRRGKSKCGREEFDNLVEDCKEGSADGQGPPLGMITVPPNREIVFWHCARTFILIGFFCFRRRVRISPTIGYDSMSSNIVACTNRESNRSNRFGFSDGHAPRKEL